MKKYKHIFFDLDRTLWDFDMNSFDALSDIFISHKLDAHFKNNEEFIQLYHKHNDRLWARYREGNIKKEILRFKRFDLTLREKGIRDKDLAKKIGADYLDLSVIKNRVFPNTYEILDYLKPKYPLYILTNGFRETQFRKMNNCKLDPYFNHVFTSETIGYNKPHIKIFQWAVSYINAKKEDCIMIGDDQAVDIIGAQKFGMDGIFFNPNNEEVISSPKYVIKDLIEIKEIL
ncbi:MAG: YjjG family noncanonical pyrimidine nucleotidase [Bacteroidales bacterium]|nr:YjjG family noncanonical pyrimidine nucleotidase [Bacteroidales bacterium]MCF8389302.1 YjjG family noncanonical pyrimidine nucleotidase [Bacteroidales bacterium]